MSNPYRSKIFATTCFEPLWAVIERKRKLRRALPVGVFLSLLLPIAAVSIHGLAEGRLPGYSSHPTLNRSMVDPSADAWGLMVTDTDARPWTGPLPIGAARPDRESAMTPIPVLEHAIREQASDEIRRCYRSSLTEQRDLSGDLIAHVAAHGRRIESVVTGPRALREAIGACVRRAIDAVHFPLVPNDVAWFHLPIRFAPSGNASALK